jgi:hypothetical protein
MILCMYVNEERLQDNVCAVVCLESNIFEVQEILQQEK